MNPAGQVQPELEEAKAAWEAGDEGTAATHATRAIQAGGDAALLVLGGAHALSKGTGRVAGGLKHLGEGAAKPFKPQLVTPDGVAISGVSAGQGASPVQSGHSLSTGGKTSTGKARTSTAKGEYLRDRATPNTKNWSAQFTNEGEARALAREKLGSDPVEVEPSKWRSRDGKWQYRVKSGDVAENHIHLEELDPKTGNVLQNLHLRWPKGADR